MRISPLLSTRMALMAFLSALLDSSAPGQNAADGFDPNADLSVYANAVQPDGSTIIGGDFNSLGGITHSNLARLNVDGALDTNFVSAADGYVLSVAVQMDAKIVVGGGFNTLSTRPR